MRALQEAASPPAQVGNLRYHGNGQRPAGMGRASLKLRRMHVRALQEAASPPAQVGNLRHHGNGQRPAGMLAHTRPTERRRPVGEAR